MGEFLCDSTDMYLYTNPYMDKYINKGAKQNHIIFDLTCEAFEMGDQVVMHYYMASENKYRAGYTPDLIEDETLAKSFYVNRTDLNKQYWRMEFYKDLEFMRIEKTQMFMRLQDPQAKEVDVPLTTSLLDFEDFRANNMTHKVYQSATLVIAVEEVQPTILNARPQTDIYIDAPIAASKQVLGIAIEVEDVNDRIIKVKSEYDTRLVSDMTADDIDLLQDRIAAGELSTKTVTMQEIALRLTFIEKEFTYRFYSFKDFFGDIGGVFGAVKLSIGESFGGWIILFFIVDLIYMIIAKHNFEYRISTIKALSPKCKMYGEHITKL
jgi:hypothetical protein